ncbi:hypothetical protein AGOR_G00132040 [Albula goreensis]|uniref:Connective tissue growth factor n=1 Tax=Albula goreensis TaxID=1534307 RepID=A0A8T3D8C6_9TELE|nr:hypothetical protein AGOR_G00132040 [Albula goreensis]
MERHMREHTLPWALLLSLLSQVCCQLCGGPCYCPSPAPQCPFGVPLIIDGCQCCQICARQEGEACNDRYLCDTHKGLHCDYSASYPGGPGECINQDQLGCELNGIRYQEGQKFQLACSAQCRCLGGGVTCVPLCPEDVRLPSPDCPNPQRVQLPGQCCKEWVCEDLDNALHTANSPHWPSFSAPQDLAPPPWHQVPQIPTSNCIEQRTEWSACSRSCGPGLSVRMSNQNWACRLERQTQLCQVRPCRATPPRTHMGQCKPSYRAAFPQRLEHRGCYSIRASRPRYCGQCFLGTRCCTPYHTHTVQMMFRCPRRHYRVYPVMVIDSCVCHYNCPYSNTAASEVSMLLA